MKLGETLVESGKITHRDVERALVAREEMGGKFGQILVKLGLVSELDVASALSELLGIRLLETAEYPEEPVNVPGLSLDFMLGNSVVPISVDNNGAVFSAVVPQDEFLAKALGLALDRPITLCLGLESEILSALQKHTAVDEEESGHSFYSELL